MFCGLISLVLFFYCLGFDAGQELRSLTNQRYYWNPLQIEQYLAMKEDFSYRNGTHNDMTQQIKSSRVLHDYNSTSYCSNIYCLYRDHNSTIHCILFLSVGVKVARSRGMTQALVVLTFLGTFHPMKLAPHVRQSECHGCEQGHNGTDT